MADYLKVNTVLFHEKRWQSTDRRRGILVDSEVFPGAVRYVIKAESIILLSGIHGIFSFDLATGPAFLNELGEVITCFSQ